MKLAKLSLAAIAVVGLSTSSFAADTLADAFKNGKVSGTLEMQYIDNAVSGTGQDTSGFAVGGELKFVTDTFNGFGAGFTFETGHTLGMEDEVAAENDTTVTIQKTALSEAYLTYAFGKTTAKIGRQYISTPLVAVSGSRVMMDFFQAAILVNTDLPNTTLVVGGVNEWVKRDIDTVVHPDDPIYTVYAKNTSIKGLTLTAQGTFLADVQNDYYAEAAYKFDAGMPITVGAQYIGTDYDAAATEDGKLYGVMVGTSFGALSLNAYYNDNTDGVTKGGWGLGNDPSYNDMWLTNAIDTAETKSYSIQAKYKVSPELSLMAWYGDFNADAAASDRTDLDFDVMYKPSGALKGMSVNVKYSMLEYDTTANKDKDHFYTFVKYAF
jgi:hypothetical protein